MAIKLDDMLRAMHNAVVKAQQIAEQQHMRMLRNYFNFDDPDHAIRYSDSDRWKPKTTVLKLPFVDGDQISYREVSVPLIALTPPSSVQIDKVSISFEATLLGFESEDPKKKGFHISELLGGKAAKQDAAAEKTGQDLLHRGAPMINFGGKDAGPKAKIKIIFKSGDPPETFARIGDRLIKTLEL